MKLNKQSIQKNKTYGVYHNRKKKILLKNGKVMTMNQKKQSKMQLNLILPILNRLIRFQLIKLSKLKNNRYLNKIKIKIMIIKHKKNMKKKQQRLKP